MSIETELQTRSQSACELCKSTINLMVYDVPPASGARAEEKLYLCENCIEQIENPDKVEVNHWRCLNDSMWSEVPAVQVVAWRMLTRLSSEGWPQDLLDMLYLDEETLAWAKATGEEKRTDDLPKHVDSHGTLLENGDTVMLTKNLDIKGSSHSAKRGTAVRGITLVADNHEQIEGRVEGQQIVILTKFVKKSK